MIKINEFQFEEGNAKQFMDAGKLYLHELRFIAKAKKIEGYLDMSYDDLCVAITNHKKKIKEG